MDNPNSSWGAYAASSIDNATNVIATSNANKRTRNWNEKMLNLQRQQALDDWNRQNEYNSPRAQMQRFQEAGLNPNLIYGQTNTAAPVRSTDSKSLVYQKPEFEKASSVLAQSTNLQMSKAQMDNLRAQNTVLVQEAALKAAQTAGSGISNAKSAFDLSQAQKLQQTSLNMAQAELENKLQEGYGRTKDFELKAQELHQKGLTNPLDLVQKALQNQLSQAQYDQIKQHMQSESFRQEVLKLDAELAKKGIRPGDQLWFRLLGVFIDKYKNWKK